MAPRSLSYPRGILLLFVGATQCIARSTGLVGKTRCENLSTFAGLPNTTLLFTEYHVNGSSVPLNGQVASCGGPNALANITADLCRVVVNISTSATSAVQMEAWLPDTWNQRLLGAGNGGTGGCIDYASIQLGTALNFASVGSNNGHNGSSGYDFFLGHPEVINDFGHRALHVEAVIGKQVIRQYYTRPARKSYYLGCSTGGRQGVQESLLYPEDFDGIVAGSPGIHWTDIAGMTGILARRSGWPQINSTGYISRAQWTVITALQISLLDPLDGVKDGIIDDPSQFQFDPELLACGVGLLNASFCLNPDQVENVRKVFEPIANTAGQIIYPSFNLGADTTAFSSNINPQTGEPELAIATLQEFYRGAVFNSTTWNATNINETDVDFARKINPGLVYTGGTNLSEFRARGGKMLTYHGSYDIFGPIPLSKDLFTGVQQTLNLSLSEMEEFLQLYIIPGMGHCRGGPSPWNIGQTYPQNWAQKHSSTQNLLLSMVDWVEHGRAPQVLIGTKYANDNVFGPILAQRTLCPYPTVSKWDGRGNTSEAGSWHCELPY